MESKEIFDTALEVIDMVKKKTQHIPTAMHILNVAKQGFSPDEKSQLSTPEHLSEGLSTL
jgi:hypothetical protein